jgi:hypothetical protein
VERPALPELRIRKIRKERVSDHDVATGEECLTRTVKSTRREDLRREAECSAQEPRQAHLEKSFGFGDWEPRTSEPLTNANHPCERGIDENCKINS